MRLSWNRLPARRRSSRRLAVGRAGRSERFPSRQRRTGSVLEDAIFASGPFLRPNFLTDFCLNLVSEQGPARGSGDRGAPAVLECGRTDSPASIGTTSCVDREVRPGMDEVDPSRRPATASPQTGSVLFVFSNIRKARLDVCVSCRAPICIMGGAAHGRRVIPPTFRASPPPLV